MLFPLFRAELSIVHNFLWKNLSFLAQIEEDELNGAEQSNSDGGSRLVVQLGGDFNDVTCTFMYLY